MFLNSTLCLLVLYIFWSKENIEVAIPYEHHCPGKKIGQNVWFMNEMNPYQTSSELGILGRIIDH